MKPTELEEKVSAIGPDDLLHDLSDQVLGVDHVAIAVENLEQSIEWYTKYLGFRVTDRRFTQGNCTAMLSAVLVSGGAVVVLVQGTSPESQVSRFIQKFGPGVQHLAFRLIDIDVAIQRLAGADQAIDTPVIADEGIRQVFLRRVPGSGVRVELIERCGGNFSDSSVDRLFRAFESRGLF